MGSFAAKHWEDKAPHPTSSVGRAMRDFGVQRSADLSRVLALPRRKLDLKAVEDATLAFAKPGGSLTLRPIQSAALLEAEEAGGLVGAIGVGHGKTLILLLLPEALKVERAVLLVKPDLKAQLLERDVPFYEQHFDIPWDRIARDAEGRLGILSYAELSVPVRVAGIPKWWQWTAHVAGAIEDPLSRFRPDAILADEAHCLRRSESARGRAFRRWMNEHPETKFAALTGSLTNGSIKDCWPLVLPALRKNSPLPLNFNQLQAWADALDPPRGDRPSTNPGALWLLASPGGSDSDLATRSKKLEDQGIDSIQLVRDAFRQRLVETPGWVATDEASFGGSLYVRKLRPKVPRALADALRDLRSTWEIGGIEFAEAMHLAQAVRRVACGFYYKPRWPGGVVDQQYVDAKREWKKEVRDFLRGRNVPGMTTELNLLNAAASGRWKSSTFAAWNAVRKRWPSEGPPRDAVWLDDYLVKEALRWAREAKEGIIWFQDVALGEAVSRAGGFPYFGEGTDAGTTNPKESPIIVCSATTQGEGKNLQAWSRNLILRPSASAKVWEQVLGRTHRPGQEEDEVWFDVLMPVPEADDALEAALVGARHTQQTQGQRQRLLLATFVE